MRRETSPPATRVVVVLDGDTDAGFRLARRLLADGKRVVAVTRHAGDAVRVMHGYPADRVMVIAADAAVPQQWERVTERIAERFGRIDDVLRGEKTPLADSA